MWALNTLCCMNGFNKWFGLGFIDFADELDVIVKEKREIKDDSQYAGLETG